MSNTLYLVTGAAGFLGGTICRQLIARGDKVRALALPNDPAIKFIPEEAEIFEGDLSSLASMDQFFRVPEGTETIVLHIASIVTVNPDFSQKVMEVNVGGTRTIVDLCLAHKEVKKLVYCSSTGAIPELPKGQQIKEVNKFNANVVEGCYSQSKALASQIVLDAANHLGLNACIVHPSGIMGPEDYAVGETTGTLIKIIEGQMPAGIDGSFNLCDVRDLAAGTIAAADKGRKGECYILGNDEVAFKDFARMVVEEAGCQDIKMFLPLKVADVMAGMMEASARRKGEKPLMTHFSVYNLARNNCFDSSKAKEELGYTTRSYRETIHDEIQWLKETGKIGNEAAGNAAPAEKETAAGNAAPVEKEKIAGNPAAEKTIREKMGEFNGKVAENAGKAMSVMEKGTIGGYKVIEHATVNSYKAIEHGVVGAYKKIEDGFVDTFMDGKRPGENALAVPAEEEPEAPAEFETKAEFETQAVTEADVEEKIKVETEREAEADKADQAEAEREVNA